MPVAGKALGVAGGKVLQSKPAQKVLGERLNFTPKDSRFLVNQEGFRAPKIGKTADAAQPSPLMDRVGMAELEVKRQLSRGKRKIQGVVERVKQPVRDYKDYNKGLKIQDNLESGNMEAIIRGHKKHKDLLTLRVENIGRMEKKYRDQSYAFHDAKRQMEDAALPLKEKLQGAHNMVEGRERD